MKKKDQELLLTFFGGYILGLLIMMIFVSGCSSMTNNSWQYNKCYDLNHINDIECYEKDLSR